MKFFHYCVPNSRSPLRNRYLKWLIHPVAKGRSRAILSRMAWSLNVQPSFRILDAIQFCTPSEFTTATSDQKILQSRSKEWMALKPTDFSLVITDYIIAERWSDDCHYGSSSECSGTRAWDHFDCWSGKRKAGMQFIQESTLARIFTNLGLRVENKDIAIRWVVEDIWHGIQREVWLPRCTCSCLGGTKYNVVDHVMNTITRWTLFPIQNCHFWIATTHPPLNIFIWKFGYV